MIARVLPGGPAGAIRDALLSHGWEGVLAAETAAALEPWAYHFTELTGDETEGLLMAAPRFGLELLTGDGWALLSGSRTRLSAMARSWQLPEALRTIAVAIGRGLPADAPESWLVGTGAVGIGDDPLVLGVDISTEAVAVCDASEEGLVARLQAHATGRHGILLVAEAGMSELARGMEVALAAGLEPERVALEPAWTPGVRDFSVLRALGRPIVCRADDPVTAALAWARGVRLYRTAMPDMLRDAIARARALGA